MHLSWRMHGWLCDLILLPRYSSLERKSCDPPIVGTLFVVFTEEEMKVSLTIRSKPLSASLQLSPHRFNSLRIASNVRTSRYSLRILAGQNARIKEKCNARTPLVDVATCFTGLVDNQRDSAKLRDAIQHLPPVRMAIPAPTAFKVVMEAPEFSIAPWPRRFMEQEMGAAILYCQLGGEIAGSERAEALKRTFEYIAEKLCDVVFVFQVCESRGSHTYSYLVTLFSDGSHLCQCRTLQVLGLCCRHFWAP